MFVHSICDLTLLLQTLEIRTLQASDSSNDMSTGKTSVLPTVEFRVESFSLCIVAEVPLISPTSNYFIDGILLQLESLNLESVSPKEQKGVNAIDVAFRNVSATIVQVSQQQLDWTKGMLRTPKLLESLDISGSLRHSSDDHERFQMEVNLDNLVDIHVTRNHLWALKRIASAVPRLGSKRSNSSDDGSHCGSSDASLEYKLGIRIPGVQYSLAVHDEDESPFLNCECTDIMIAVAKEGSNVDFFMKAQHVNIHTKVLFGM